MNCHEARAQLYNYLDEEMGLLRRLRVKWHLRGCPPCGDGFDFEGKLKQRVKEGCTDPVPEELYDRIRTFLREHDTEGSAG